MAISGVKEILKIGNKGEETNDAEVALGNRADEIDTRMENSLVRQIASELKRTIRKTEGLKALSAPAIGYEKRIFCIKFDNDDIKTFINPIISQAKGLQLSREKCSSIEGREFIVPRNNDIMVMYQTPMGEVQHRQLIGMAACVFQHEIQHLDGLILSDIGLEIDSDFDEATDEEREEVIDAYLDSLDIKRNKITEEINNDPELKELSDGIKFMEGVAKGEVKLEAIKKGPEEESTSSN